MGRTWRIAAGDGRRRAGGRVRAGGGVRGRVPTTHRRGRRRDPHRTAHPDAIRTASRPSRRRRSVTWPPRRRSEPPDPHAAHMTSPMAPHMASAAPPIVPWAAAEQSMFDEQWATARNAVRRARHTRRKQPPRGTRSPRRSSVRHRCALGGLDADRPRRSTPPARRCCCSTIGRAAPRAGRVLVLGAAIHPDGFAGTNDVWHQHTNLCIVNGWVDREMAATRGDCAGSFLAGADLWMLHAWVVPGHDEPRRSVRPVRPRPCARGRRACRTTCAAAPP